MVVVVSAEVAVEGDTEEMEEESMLSRLESTPQNCHVMSS